PAFTIFKADRLMLCAACIEGRTPPAPPGRALLMLVPATAVRLPALLMVPALIMLWTAFRLRLKFCTSGWLKPASPPPGSTVVKRAPGWLTILSAETVALVVSG